MSPKTSAAAGGPNVTYGDPSYAGADDHPAGRLTPEEEAAAARLAEAMERVLAEPLEPWEEEPDLLRDADEPP